MLFIWDTDTKEMESLLLLTCWFTDLERKMHTVDGNLLSCTQEHNHGPNLMDCEAKATLSSIKEIAASTRTPNHL